MEWVERWNDAIRYIEENMTQRIDYEQLGRIACCSAYHFQRMFAYMAGIPLSEYIRRRKMSLAAVELQSGRERMINIAWKYGYHSPTAFNRAFRAVHGCSPTAVRRGTGAVTSFPPISFQFIAKGVEPMHYRLERKEAFRIVGAAAPLHRELEKNFAVVPKLWETCLANGTIEKLSQMASGTPASLLGISACGDAEQWRYFIAVAAAQDSPEFETYMIPAATWAVFPGTGTNKDVQELERRIFTEWLPTSGYAYGNAPDMEVYLHPDPEHTVFEIWVPVEKKS